MSTEAAHPERRTGGGLAVTSLVLGIVGIVLVFIPIIGYITLPMAILGVIFGVVGWRGGERKGMAITGTILSVIVLVLFVIAVAVIANALNEASTASII